jgi:hypothetical protein
MYVSKVWILTSNLNSIHHKTRSCSYTADFLANIKHFQNYVYSMSPFFSFFLSKHLKRKQYRQIEKKKLWTEVSSLSVLFVTISFFKPKLRWARFKKRTTYAKETFWRARTKIYLPLPPRPTFGTFLSVCILFWLMTSAPGKISS